MEVDPFNESVNVENTQVFIAAQLWLTTYKRSAFGIFRGNLINQCSIELTSKVSSRGYSLYFTLSF